MTARAPIAVDFAGAAELLGVSEGLVRKMHQLRELPHVKVGARVVFRVSALERWLEEHEEGPACG